MGSNPARKTWFGTLNNYDDEDEERYADMGMNPEVKMIVCGKETCPTTGTPHLQFVCTLSKAVRLGGAREFFGRKCHLEPLKGTIQEAINYCKKEGNVLVEKTTNIQGDLTVQVDNGMEIYQGHYECEIYTNKFD